MAKAFLLTNQLRELEWEGGHTNPHQGPKMLAHKISSFGM